MEAARLSKAADGGLARLAAARRARFRQDPHRRRICPRRRRDRARAPHRARGADRARCPGNHDRGRERPALGWAVPPAPALRAVIASADLGQWRRRDIVLGRRAEPAARPAARSRLVRRARRLALPPGLGHADVRLAVRTGSALHRHDDAAPDQIGSRIARRPDRRRHPRPHRR